MLPGKVFDDARSVQFRKQLLATQWLHQTKPSSIPNARMIERRGSDAIVHALWLVDEANSLRFSSTYQNRMQAAEMAVKAYLNRVHKALNKLKK